MSLSDDNSSQETDSSAANGDFWRQKIFVPTKVDYILISIAMHKTDMTYFKEHKYKILITKLKGEVL